MAFKMVMFPPFLVESWVNDIQRAVPGSIVRAYQTPGQGAHDIEDADAIYGNLPKELFPKAKKLRWIAGSMAGLGAGFFHDALVRSGVVVTNMRGIYNNAISVHIMAFLLAFARRLDQYQVNKQRRLWKRMDGPVYLPGATALIIGVGGVGSETARLCAAFGMHVIGVDPRTEGPVEGMAELFKPQALDELLGRADFVILTTPETPETRRLIDARRFRLMKPTAFFINIGRGICVDLDDLTEALRSKTIAGAGLDVYEIEPLPSDHPLWAMPNVLMTPHSAIHDAPYLDDQRLAILLENCKRFDKGEPLLNVVDKKNWY